MKNKEKKEIKMNKLPLEIRRTCEPELYALCERHQKFCSDVIALLVAGATYNSGGGVSGCCDNGCTGGCSGGYENDRNNSCNRGCSSGCKGGCSFGFITYYSYNCGDKGFGTFQSFYMRTRECSGACDRITEEPFCTFKIANVIDNASCFGGEKKYERGHNGRIVGEEGRGLRMVQINKIIFHQSAVPPEADTFMFFVSSNDFVAYYIEYDCRGPSDFDAGVISWPTNIRDKFSLLARADCKLSWKRKRRRVGKLFMAREIEKNAQKSDDLENKKWKGMMKDERDHTTEVAQAHLNNLRDKNQFHRRLLRRQQLGINQREFRSSNLQSLSNNK